MKLLAFDTSATTCSVAILNGSQRHIVDKVAPMQQARLILPMISETLAAASLTLADLDAIAYSCGPGSFTGVRIASSVAQGLGFPHQTPILQLSSLAVIAQAAFEQHGSRSILVAVDARMNKIYWASYVINSQGLAELHDQEQLCVPEQIPMPSTEQDWYGVGDGWNKYSQLINNRLNINAKKNFVEPLPTATALLNLAAAKFSRGETISPTSAIPTYFDDSLYQRK